MKTSTIKIIAILGIIYSNRKCWEVPVNFPKVQKMTTNVFRNVSTFDNSYNLYSSKLEKMYIYTEILLLTKEPNRFSLWKFYSVSFHVTWSGLVLIDKYTVVLYSGFRNWRKIDKIEEKFDENLN